MDDSYVQLLMSFYCDSDNDFKDYVDKYCKKHEITVIEAFSHKVVKEVYKALNEQKKRK